MDDYTKNSEELRRLQKQELERRLGDWRQELTAVQKEQREQRAQLQKDLSAEDRRPRNRVLDLVVPGRRRERHEHANSALAQEHATVRDEIQQRGAQERDYIDARYAQRRKQLDAQERRRLETREAKRGRHAEHQRKTIEEKRALFARYFPTPHAPDRSRDRTREDHER